MEISPINVLNVIDYTTPQAGSFDESELPKVFDKIFLKLMWDGMSTPIGGQGETPMLSGPWGDMLFNQVLEGIAQQQGLGLGRLLLQGADTTTRG